jgi:hypothetical protein
MHTHKVPAEFVETSYISKTADPRNGKTSSKEYGTTMRVRGKSAASISKSALKLAVALELRSEGYSRISFDRPIESCVGKVRIHVLGEDELGLRMAVYCISREHELNPNDVLDIVTAIQQSISDDGDVAIAIPIDLLEKAGEIFGMTPKVFLVDYDMRVWVYTHYHGGVTKALKRGWLEIRGQNDLDEDDDQQQKTQCLSAAKACTVEYVV